jgi:hypothetical protein
MAIGVQSTGQTMTQRAWAYDSMGERSWSCRLPHVRLMVGTRFNKVVLIKRRWAR